MAKKAVSVEPLPKQGCEVCNMGLRLLDAKFGLSGTPAEAGVREAGNSIRAYCYKSQWNPCRSRGARFIVVYTIEDKLQVSVEPLPKQGCEGKIVDMRKYSSPVSVEPLPKQGCEGSNSSQTSEICGVSVEPLPKQGCEQANKHIREGEITSQWNPCRSRGARLCKAYNLGLKEGLSGTPAEAGVRGCARRITWA